MVSFKFKRIEVTKRMAVEAYYREASNLLHTPYVQEYLAPRKELWELHCLEGLSRNEIAEAIKHDRKPYAKSYVQVIINRIAKEIKSE